MEGPALAFKVLLLLAVVMAIYRRFERVHARFPVFEAFIRGAPTLVVIRTREATAVAERIRAALDGDRAFAGTGRRPWPFYALRLVVAESPGVVTIRARDCALLRVEGHDPPSLVDVVRNALGGRDAEVWFHSELWVDLEGGETAEAGWTFQSGRDELAPRQSSPADSTSVAKVTHAGTSMLATSRAFFMAGDSSSGPGSFLS